MLNIFQLKYLKFIWKAEIENRQTCVVRGFFFPLMFAPKINKPKEIFSFILLIGSHKTKMVVYLLLYFLNR